MLAQVSPSAVLGSDLGLDLGPDELAELLSEARLPRDNGARPQGMSELGSQSSTLTYASLSSIFTVRESDCNAGAVISTMWLLVQGTQGWEMMRRGLVGKGMTRRTWSGRRRSCWSRQSAGTVLQPESFVIVDRW